MSSYLFIDGAYLRKHFNEQMQTFYGVVPVIDFGVLAASLKSERTSYYDAIDYARHATESEDGFQARVTQAEGFHDHINNLPGFHVREGHVRRSPKRRNRQQKAVDIQLAVDALEHAARGNMKLMMASGRRPRFRAVVGEPRTFGRSDETHLCATARRFRTSRGRTCGTPSHPGS
jgi:hypothetical protein